MKIGQWYYTSARRGLSGRAGFQTQAATPGLPTALQAKLETIGSYTPPSSFPTSPPPEAISEMPVSLVFERMENSDAVLGQSRYVGQDYSGRFGNYFAHFLIIDAEDVKQLDFPPIALWRSTLWTTQESPTTDLQFLDRLEPNGGSNPAFLRTLPARLSTLAHLGDMLSAIERALAGGPRLIIANSDNLVACWIALATQLLPLSLAWNISFTTYVRAPAFASSLICGTTLDSDFGFSDFEIQHQYAVFDFVKDRYSPVEVSTFAAAIMQAFHSTGCDPFRFPEFALRVAPHCGHEDLGAAFAAYALTCGLSTGAAFEEVCVWCTLHAGGFLAGEFSALTEALREEALASPGRLQAFADLMGAGLDAGTANESMPGFVRLLLQVLPTAEVDWLRRIPALLQAGSVRMPASAPPVPFETIVDPARLLAVLSVLEHLGAIEGGAARIRSAAREVLGSRLGDPAIAAALPELIHTAHGRLLLEGITEALENHAETPATLAESSGLLRNASVAGALEQLARSRASAGLLCWIEADRMKKIGMAPYPIFIRLLQMQKNLTDHAPAKIADRAFGSVWPKEVVDKISSESLIGLYEEPISRQDLEGSRILSVLAASLTVRNEPLRTADIKQARRLLQFPDLLEPSAMAALESLLLLSGALPFRTRADEMARLWAILSKVDPAIGRKLLILASRMVFELKGPGHKAHLKRGLRDYGAEFARLYAEELHRVCAARSPEFFLDLAHCWLALAEHGEPPGGEAITRAFTRFYREQNRHARAMVDAGFANSHDLQSRWRAMITGESFLDRTLAMFRRKK